MAVASERGLVYEVWFYRLFATSLLAGHWRWWALDHSLEHPSGVKQSARCTFVIRPTSGSAFRFFVMLISR